MPILGLNFTKISAEKKAAEAKEVKINTMPIIKEVIKTELRGLGKPMEVLSILFSFTSTFEPKIGALEIEGNIIYTPAAKPSGTKAEKEEKSLSLEKKALGKKEAEKTEGSDLKEIVAKWKKDNALPADMHIEIVNHIFRKASPLALLLTDAVQLPPVIGIPKLQKK